MMQQVCKAIADNHIFRTTIIVIIVIAGVVVGMETYPHLVEQYGTQLHWINTLILAVFTVEIVIKILAHGSKPWRYFTDPWNIFDFAIVAVLYLPVHAEFIAVLRLARILRVLRLITALPKLQILVSALLKSIPSMGYVGVLLLLLFYCYAVCGVFFFGHNDPVHFGNLQTSMLSLFRVVTLEDWTDIMYIQMYGSNVYAYSNPQNFPVIPQATPILGAMFFVTFVLMGTMIILNLFIGVIMNAMDEARNDEVVKTRSHLRRAKHISLSDEIDLVHEQLSELTRHLETLQKRLKDEMLDEQPELRALDRDQHQT